MTWLSYALFGVWLGGVWFFGVHANDHPLGAWKHVGTYAYVNVVNQTADSLPVGTIAPKVDRTIRLLGFVPAHDSAYFRLPYADTDILLLVGDGWLPLSVHEPGVHRVVVHKKPDGEP